MLDALDWNLTVTTDEFNSALESIEYQIADRTMKRLGFGTYCELAAYTQLSMNNDDFLWHHFLQPLVSIIGLVSLTYTAVAMSLLLTPLYLDTIARIAPTCLLKNQPIDLPITHSTDILMPTYRHRSCGEELMTLNAHAQFDRYVNTEKRTYVNTEERAIAREYQPPCVPAAVATHKLNDTVSSSTND